MRQAVVMRDLEFLEQHRHPPGERSGAGKEHAEPVARRVGEILQRPGDDGAGVIGGVDAGEKFDFADGRNSRAAIQAGLLDSGSRSASGEGDASSSVAIASAASNVFSQVPIQAASRSSASVRGSVRQTVLLSARRTAVSSKGHCGQCTAIETGDKQLREIGCFLDPPLPRERGDGRHRAPICQPARSSSR